MINLHEVSQVVWKKQDSNIDLQFSSVQFSPASTSHSHDHCILQYKECDLMSICCVCCCLIAKSCLTLLQPHWL